MKLKVASLRDKIIWNAAVKATLLEVKQYNGLIPDDDDREILIRKVAISMSYTKGVPESNQNIEIQY